MEKLDYKRYCAVSGSTKNRTCKPIFNEDRKLFGRYFFQNFFQIFDRYDKGIRKIFQTINDEYENIKGFLVDGQQILSIGGGIRWSRALYFKKFPITKIDLIEKNMFQIK